MNDVAYGTVAKRRFCVCGWSAFATPTDWVGASAAHHESGEHDRRIAEAVARRWVEEPLPEESS